MRIAAVLLFCIFHIHHLVFANDTYTIQEAIDHHLIDVAISGNDNSTHYLKPITFELTNKTMIDLEISIDRGLTLISIDTAFQNFMIMQEELLTLQAHDIKTLPVYAMCIRKNKASPGNTTNFKLGGFAQDKLLAVSKYVSENNHFNTLGQYAVWAISDNYPIRNISGFDTTAARQLRETVAHITGKPVPQFVPGDYEMDYYEPVISMQIYGSFGFIIPEPTDVVVAMFNAEGIVVRELFNKKDIYPGNYEYEYSFDGTVYTEDLYYLKMIMNEQVVSSTEMRMYDEE